MLTRTHTEAAPWTIVRADDDHAARLNVIADLLSRVKYKGRDKKLAQPDRKVVFSFDKKALTDGRLAR
jgi:hypothetical protein